MADAPTPGGKKGLLSKEEKEAVKARQIEVMKAECSAAELLMSGAVAGAIGKSAVAPIDRVKILYQVNPSRSFTFASGLKTFKTIVNNTGVEGLWRGNGSAMLRVMPYSATVFMTFDKAHLALNMNVMKEHDRNTIKSRFAAGAIAGVTATAVTYPFDLIRAQMAAHWNVNPLYTNAFSGLMHIMKTQGFSGMYRGFGPTLYGIVPYGGISFTTFETLKKSFRIHMNLQNEKDIPFQFRLFAGGVAGLIATTATYPFHVVRRRMQVNTSESFIPQYRSTFHALTEIYTNEGIVKGLFKGMSLTWFKAPIAHAVSFAVNDFLKLKVLTSKKEIKYEELRARQIKARKEQATALRLSAVSTAASSSSFPTSATTTATMPTEMPIAATSTVPSSSDDEDDEDFLRDHELADIDEDMIQVQPESTDSGGSHVLPSPSRPGFIYQLISGGLAGAVAKSVIAPADRIKILYQVNSARPFSYRGAFKSMRKIVDNSGVSGLWRGHGSTLLRVIPYSAISYTSYELYIDALSSPSLIASGASSSSSAAVPAFPGFYSSDVVRRFLAGALAGATATACTYPLDLMRARMAAHWAQEPLYRNYTHAFTTILQKEGSRALFDGLKPTLMGIIPYAGLSFATFNSIKAYVVKEGKLASDRDIPAPIRLSAGAFAGLIAQSATYPLDILRRRMQVYGRTSLKDVSILDVAKKIVHSEGVRGGLYKGLSMNWIKGPIAVATSFTVNDFLKSYLVGNDSS